MSSRADAAPTLAVRFPDLAVEWHPDRNGDLSPAVIRVQSNRTVWWRCSLGHEWEARVYNRTLGGNGCPYCVGKRASATYNLQVLHPGVAAEWHPTRNGTLTADAVIPKSNRRVWWRCPSGHEWEAPISKRCGGRGCPYCAGKYATPDRNLAVVHPALAAQWHPTRNGQRRPESVLPASGLRAWWRCDQGHTWATRVCSRSQGGTGCPECADPSKKGVPLGEKAPELLDEWDLDLNGGPGDDVAAGSALRVWWHCRRDSSHRWRATVRHRVRGTGCPYCAGKLPTTDRNLAVVYPTVAAEWHPDRNGDLSPTDVLPRSHTTVWWRCPEGHDWEATPNSRADGDGCPLCARRWPTPDHNLAVVYPDVAAEWHPTGNGDLHPDAVSPHGGTKAWWRCPQGHEWETFIYSRTRLGTGCPTCAGLGHVLDRWMARRGVLAASEIGS